MDAVLQQVGMAVDTVINSVLGAISAVWELLNAILELTSVILNIPNFIASLSRTKFNELIKREQCEELIAAITACLLNKFLGDPIADFQKKIISKINEVGYNVNQALTDEFYDLNVCAAYVEQEAFLMNKCSHQMEGLYTQFGMELDPSEEAKKNAEKQKGKATIDSKGKVKVAGTNTNVGKGTSDSLPITGLTSAAGENALGVDEETAVAGPFSIDSNSETAKASESFSNQSYSLYVVPKEERDILSLSASDVGAPKPEPRYVLSENEQRQI